MVIEYSARSHVGRVRENNEDNIYVDGVFLTPDMRERPFTIDGTTSPAAIFAVCDGVGGEDNGEIASFEAVHRLSYESDKLKAADAKSIGETVQTYADEVNSKLRFDVPVSGKRTGTTIALAVIRENGIYCFNIGDSRIYALHKNKFSQVTNDHTVIAEQVKNALRSTDQAVNPKDGNKLTRCLGIGKTYAVEIYPPITGNNRIMICSDGLTDMVNAAEIENILRVSKRSGNAADYLLNTALLNGGKDNVSVIVIDVKDSGVLFMRDFAKMFKR
jgi:protein phosphatase